MSEHAEISIESLECIGHEIDQSMSLLKEFKTHVKPKRQGKIKQIDDLITSLSISREIVLECINEPIHDGYHT